MNPTVSGRAGETHVPGCPCQLPLNHDPPRGAERRHPLIFRTTMPSEIERKEGNRPVAQTLSPVQRSHDTIGTIDASEAAARHDRTAPTGGGAPPRDDP